MTPQSASGQKKKLDGIEYDFFSVKKVTLNPNKKPLIPARLPHFYAVLKYRKKIFSYPTENILIQTPEVLFSTQKYWKKRNTAMVFAGLENPLNISRYKYVEFFSNIYEKYLFSTIKYIGCTFACADKDSIRKFSSKSKGIIPIDKLYQLPTRVDTSIFYKSDNKADSKLKLNVTDNNKVIVVTSGRLHWAKGWKFMIDSFELFLKDNENAHLFFLGDGNEKNEIIAYINDKKLSDKITLVGIVSHEILADYLKAANLFVMGSYIEGFSTSLVEAVVSGVPSCVTTFSSATDLIQDGYNGYVCLDRDEVRFAELMSKSLLIPEENLKKSSEEAAPKYAINTLKKDILEHWKLK